MKNFSKCLLSIAGVSSIAFSGLANATNGDLMIGQGAESRAMGGVGIAKSFGAASGLANPAMINSVKSREVSGAAIAFMPDVVAASNAGANAAGTTVVSVPSATSTSDLSLIPEMAYANRFNENIVYGLSIMGTAGMGVDYSDIAFGTATDNGAFNMKTNLQLLKVAVPVSYETSGFTVGVAPILQYGTLELSHQTSDGAGGFNLLQSPNSSDTAFGFEVGGAFDLTSVGVKGLTLGAVYKSKIGMEYKDTLASSVTAFGGAAATGIASGDELEQPREMGVGAAYTMGRSTIAIDAKHIAWGEAAGYKDFGWLNQKVYAIGYEYATSKWAVRAGYNYGKNPIADQGGGAADYGGAVRNFFNLAGFPGVVESHITFGGGYSISKALTVDTAVVYAQEISVSYSTSGMTQAFAVPAGNNDAKDSTVDVVHSQLGFVAALSYKF